MSEAEVLELIAVWGANTITAFTVYISFTFAYLVTAFVAGPRLTKFQAFIASGLYILAAGATVLAEVVWLQGMFAISEAHPTVVSSLTLFNGEFWVKGMSSILGMGMLISLYFMWRVRRRKVQSA